jgi:hypothetical protein
MSKTKRKSLVEAERQMELLLKRVGYTGKFKGQIVNEIPDYRSTNPIPTSDQIPTKGKAKDRLKYSGNELAGVALVHKSNYEPIRKDNKQAAIDSAHQRRN